MSAFLGAITSTQLPMGKYPHAYTEKEAVPPQVTVSPIAKSYITKENLQNALQKAAETLSADSEKTTHTSERDTTSDAYPSAPNGASVTASARSAGNPVKVFSNGLTEKFEILTNREKFKSQAKLTFPITYSFLDKVFNKQKHTMKDAFAIFNEIRSYLEERKYEKLPDFAGLCDKASSLTKNLENMETALDSIKQDFHDESIYQALEGASEEETQAWYDKRARVEKGLNSLGPTIKNLDEIINFLNHDVLSTEQSFGVRMITSLISGIGYIIAFTGGVGAPLFCTSLLASFGIESKQYSLKQDIKKWESFKKLLDGLRDKNPLMEEEVINQLLANNYRNQNAIKSLVEDKNQIQTEANEQVDKKLEDIQQAKDDAAAARKAAEDSNRKLDDFIGSVIPVLNQFKVRRDSSDSGYLSSSPEDAPISRREVDAMLKQQEERHAKEKEEIAKLAASEATKQTIAALQAQGLLKLA